MNIAQKVDFKMSHLEGPAKQAVGVYSKKGEVTQTFF